MKNKHVRIIKDNDNAIQNSLPTAITKPAPPKAKIKPATDKSR